jgi:hypothetical protein
MKFVSHKLPNKFTVTLEHFQKLSWKNRFRILLGMNVIIQTEVRIDKRDGRVWQNSVFMLTDALTKEDASRRVEEATRQMQRHLTMLERELQ